MTAKTITITRGSEMTLATYYAKREVKREWQRQGRKLQTIEASEIARAAHIYLDQHPELIEEASEQIRTNPRFAFARVRSDAQRAKAQKQRTSAVHMSGANGGAK